MSLKDIIREAKKKGFSEEEISRELIKKGYSRAEINAALPQKEMRKREGYKTLPFFVRIGKAFSPEFSKEVKDESIWPSFSNLLAVIAFYSLIGIVLSIVLSSIASSISGGGRSLTSFFGLTFVPIAIVIALILIFAYAGLNHLLMKVFGGSGRLTDSFNATAYGLIPGLLCTAIPYIGFLGLIYSFVLVGFHLSEYHSVSKAKGIITAFILPLLLILIPIILLIYLLTRLNF